MTKARHDIAVLAGSIYQDLEGENKSETKKDMIIVGHGIVPHAISMNYYLEGEEESGIRVMDCSLPPEIRPRVQAGSGD